MVSIPRQLGAHFGSRLAAEFLSEDVDLDPVENSSLGETILVVDDVESIRHMVCTLLSQAGYTCLEAKDGAEALRLVKRIGRLTLVLTDMLMPNMDGYEMACHIATLRPEVRIIFMSGYTGDAVVRQLDPGPSVFLAKPFTGAALMDTVRAALDGPWRGLPEIRRPGPEADQPHADG
jgi:CheY-like chemotaxis protein